MKKTKLNFNLLYILSASIRKYSDVFKRAKLEQLIKPIAGKRENGFDKFPGVSFMSSDVPPYLQNIGKEAEVKTN